MVPPDSVWLIIRDEVGLVVFESAAQLPVALFPLIERTVGKILVATAQSVQLFLAEKIDHVGRDLALELRAGVDVCLSHRQDNLREMSPNLVFDPERLMLWEKIHLVAFAMEGSREKLEDLLNVLPEQALEWQHWS